MSESAMNGFNDALKCPLIQQKKSNKSNHSPDFTTSLIVLEKLSLETLQQGNNKILKTATTGEPQDKTHQMAVRR